MNAQTRTENIKMSELPIGTVLNYEDAANYMEFVLVGKSGGNVMLFNINTGEEVPHYGIALVNRTGWAAGWTCEL